ncbi:hypothetical protein [Maricaulis virginensis]|uniref:hypothetical protein n=1 Tax=Maricaulis virginensis TaxID=144022 RepID=UPI0022F24E54|nr:hypothetical protein [Maricaulis virginensis]
MLAEARRKTSDLERQNAVLIASHQAMITAVGELGDMRAWRRFFEDYQHILDYLEEGGALGQNDAEITELDRG